MNLDQLNHREIEDRHRGSFMSRHPTPPIVRGEGCHLIDATGVRYLDLTRTAPFGHGHRRLAHQLAEQAAQLLACPGNLDCAARAGFLAALHRVLPPRLSCTFLGSGGSEANKAALKLARLATGRRGSVALEGSFCDRTTGALSVTWNPPGLRAFLPLLNPIRFVRRDDLAGLDAAIDDGTAALVPEVIQGEGGAHPLNRELVEAGQRQCRERGALLRIDDVQTGIGRTGAWLAHSRFGLGPDLVTLGRGTAGGFPLSATCMTGEVAEALFPSAHDTTFGGGPLACQAGLTTRETLAEEGLVLRGLPGVRAVCGGGLMVGVELRRRVGPILARLLRDHQILALQASSTVLRYLTPLVISDTGIDLGIEATAEVVSP